MKKDIFNENKGKSGIYMFTNKITKEIYIGQSSDLSNRFKNYFNLSYIKSKASLRISRALINYGYPKFSISILEYCDKSDLSTRENFYFYKINPQYNILKKAGSSLNSKHSEIPKARISKSLKAVSVKEKSESKKLMSLKKLKESNPLFEKTHSENSKEFKLIGSFVSARRAGKFLGISGTTVIKYRNSGEIFKDRYKFSSK